MPVHCCARYEVVRKRAERDLQRAQARLHLVQGFLLAMNDLDKVRSSSASNWGAVIACRETHC